MNWKDITVEQPRDNERVLTWNKRFNEARIQVYNEFHKCWDTEDGDDYEYSFDTTIIQHWARIKRPDA